MMNLTVDIGNTNLTLGLFKNNKLVIKAALATKNSQYYAFLKPFFRKYAIDTVIVASVVPQATRKLETALKKLKAKPVLILGKNLVVPIKNRYQFPKQVGQDRLVDAFACVKLYGSPAIVVDFGTAITFDVISRKQEYLGGMILPGIETSLSALKEKTALLPKVKLSRPPKEIIGRNTRDSILSGIIFGFAGLTDNLIKKLKLKLGKRTLVIGTGGNIKFISSQCRELYNLVGCNGVGFKFS
ncbi:MAG: type III pantothenate kinase [Candidatus Omnitrophica bacterium]|nr:type III pantothenate kinase [Candidatus Omnitrophota bacterium]